MASPKSFEGLLRKYCPGRKRILEWGPGYSTQIMREVCPDADIISVENEEKWCFVALETLKGLDIEIILHEAPVEDRTHIGWLLYTSPLVGGKFDLIFIDGRERVRCMETIIKRQLLNKDGVVLLHDSERGEYRKGIELFTLVEEGDGTVCLNMEGVRSKG